MSHDALDPRNLLVHAPRLRALAHGLVRDAQLAEDLVQETWVRALESGPRGERGEGSLRRWLGVVLRNLAFQEHRSAARRAGRERAAARYEGGEALEASQDRFALHRELVGAIGALEEPYRRVILLRYFEGLPPRRIAARLELPLKTVKTRLHRGLGLLRERLDQQHGGREHWLGAFAPLLRPSPGAILPWTISGGISAGGALPATAALALVSTALFLTRGVWRAPSAPLPAPAIGPSAAPAIPGLAAGVAAGGLGARTPRAGPGAPSAPVQGLGAGGVRGRALDGNGLPLAGVHVGYQGSWPGGPVATAADGGFELPEPPEGFHPLIVGLEAGFATVLASRSDLSPSDGEHVLVLAPAVALGGVVLRPDGGPAAGAQLCLEIPLSFRARFRDALESAQAQTQGFAADEQGRFRLEDVPALDCLRLLAWTASAEGGLALSGAEELALEIRLHETLGALPRPGQEALTVLGEVRHAAGGLAPGARVALAGVQTSADANGLFELVVQRAGPGADPYERRLVAAATGELPAFFEPALDAAGQELWPSFVSLVLGGPPLSLAGHVLGRDGLPLAEAPVWIEDLTFLASGGHDFATLEHWLAGREGRWFSTLTDELGRFELGGLDRREYRLAVLDRATLQIAVSAPCSAGSPGATDVELVLDPAGVWQELRGRLVDRQGAPVGGAGVHAQRVTYRVVSPTGSICYGLEDLGGARTDDDGRFTLGPLACDGAVLTLSGQGFEGLEFALDPAQDPLDVVLTVPARVHLQVELAGPAPAAGSGATLELRDAEERPLDYGIFAGGSTWVRDQVTLDDEREFAGGRTPVFTILDSVRWVVLLDADGVELRRAPVVLDATHDLTVVRL